MYIHIYVCAYTYVYMYILICIYAFIYIYIYRSRSRSRSPIPATWAHDKYSKNVIDSPTYDEKLERRRELNNYRPPSPTWVSRAGGVAIMRKKISD
jgi:hypothetical protein